MLRNTVHASRTFSTSGVQRQQAAKDIIANAFLKQIRAVTEKQRAAGSLISTSPELKKELDDQLNRLAAKYHISSLDEVGKLDVKLEQSKVVNSAQVLLEPDEAPKDAAKLPATSTVSYFEKIAKTDHPDRNKFYIKWFEKGWSPEEKAEYEESLLWKRKFMTPQFVAKLKALAEKGTTKEDTFETRLQEAKQRNELLKEYVQLYEKGVDYKWSRDILMTIAQIGPDHPYYNKAPEDKDQLLEEEPAEYFREAK